jgi:hypothetical protein
MDVAKTLAWLMKWPVINILLSSCPYMYKDFFKVTNEFCTAAVVQLVEQLTEIDCSNLVALLARHDQKLRQPTNLK